MRTDPQGVRLYDNKGPDLVPVFVHLRGEPLGEPAQLAAVYTRQARAGADAARWIKGSN